MHASRSAILVLCAVMLSALPAAAFVAANGMRVIPEGPRSFVVPPARGLKSATDFWCAAGDFTIRGLGLRPSTRVYRMTSGSGGASGLRFALDPQGAVPPGVTVFGAKDSGLSASLAQVYCTSMRQDDRLDR